MNLGGTTEIRDPQRLLSDANEIKQLINNIMRTQEELSQYCSEIRGAWTSDTVDKESYLAGIEKNLQNIGTLVSALSGLGDYLISYAQQQMANANRA